MPFDYSHTCPDIDREIAAAKDKIKDYLESVAEELSPLFYRSGDPLEQWASSNADSLYEELESCFETVRKANEDMRSEAEKQFSDIQSDLEEANEEIRELRERERDDS